MQKSSPTIVWLVTALLGSWICQPVLPAERVGSSSAGATVERLSANGSPAQRVTMFIPGVFSESQARLIEARSRIAERLIALDVEPERAYEQASQLTADDLDVLLANPDMLQRAGDSDTLSQTVIVAIIVVGVIVIIGVAGSGSLSIH